MVTIGDDAAKKFFDLLSQPRRKVLPARYWDRRTKLPQIRPGFVAQEWMITCQLYEIEIVVRAEIGEHTFLSVSTSLVDTVSISQVRGYFLHRRIIKSAFIDNDFVNLATKVRHNLRIAVTS